VNTTRQEQEDLLTILTSSIPGGSGATGATGPSSFIPFTTQTEGASTPNPGSVGKFTINGTNMYVWNGSLWVLFSGSSSV
jgi:hypothetical protein